MVNLDDFKYGGTNLTAFRLLDPEREEVKQVVQDWIFGRIFIFIFSLLFFLVYYFSNNIIYLGIFKY